MDLKIHNIALTAFYRGLDNLIEMELLKDRYVIMFGSSLVAGMVISYLNLKGITVDAIVDNDKTRENTQVCQTIIYSPEKYKHVFHEDAAFLICSFWQDEMICQLKGYGYEDKHMFKIMNYEAVLNDYSFADRTGYKEMTRNQVKSCQVGILKYLDTVCRANNIRYFLAYGTLLGAVRHKGFIPWDDDVDVVVELKDLFRLCEIMESDRDYGVISCINTPGYFEQYSLMVDRHTISDINTFPTQISTGVSIDIYPLCGLPADEDEYRRYVKTLKGLEMKRCAKMYSPAECKKACDELLKFMSQYDYDDLSYAGCLLSPYYLKERVEKEVYGKGHILEFEGAKLVVPDRPDALLTKIYGDYMVLPPSEQRQGHHYFKAYFQ